MRFPFEMCPFRGSPAVPPSLAASSLPTSAHGGKHLNRRLRVDRYSFPFPRNTRSLRAPIPANGYTRGFRQLGEGGVRSSTTGATRNWCGEARPFLDRIACRGGCGGYPEGVDKPLSESKCATAVVACAPSSHSRASSTVSKSGMLGRRSARRTFEWRSRRCPWPSARSLSFLLRSPLCLRKVAKPSFQTGFRVSHMHPGEQVDSARAWVALSRGSLLATEASPSAWRG